eukprot:COSAG01_NODE_2082_length_8464_cov_17.995696_5_plen_180_part_00
MNPGTTVPGWLLAPGALLLIVHFLRTIPLPTDHPLSLPQQDVQPRLPHGYAVLPRHHLADVGARPTCVPVLPGPWPTTTFLARRVAWSVCDTPMGVSQTVGSVTTRSPVEDFGVAHRITAQAQRLADDIEELLVGPRHVRLGRAHGGEGDGGRHDAAELRLEVRECADGATCARFVNTA